MQELFSDFLLSLMAVTLIGFIYFLVWEQWRRFRCKRGHHHGRQVCYTCGKELINF